MESFSTLLFTAFLCFSGNAFAQDGSPAPQNSLLPEINPQDIEIRSEFRARFPGLRRQPILGFNPKPRVFQIDPNRMPFMESRDQAVANISITQLDRPEPPKKSVLEIPYRHSAFVKAGFGNYISPEFDGYFFSDLNDQSSITGSVNFQSSGSHLDVPSGFRYLNGDVRYRNELKEDLTLTTDINFTSDFNRMFDLTTPVSPCITAAIPEKNYMGSGAELTLVQTNNSLEGWTATAGGNFYNTELSAETATLNGETKEVTFNAGFSNKWAGQRLYETFSVNADVDVGSYDNSASGAETWIMGTGGFQYRKMINFSLHLNADAGAAYVKDAFSSRIYFTPEITLRWNLRDAITITGRVSGKPGMLTVQEHQQANRFLFGDIGLRHNYTSGAYGEIELQIIEGNRIFGGVSYEIIKDYSYYTRTAETGAGQTYYTYYDLNFGKANVFELFGGITQQLVPEKFWFDGRFYARSPKLDNGNTIPYHEKLGVNGSFSFKPVKELTLNSWAQYVGKRASVSNGEDLSAFLLFNAGAEYRINKKFGVYVKVLNILGQNYELWDGYQERPLQVFGGITLNL